MGQKRQSNDQGRSQRQLRVGEVIRRALSDVFARGDLHDPELSNHSITVSEVRASPDLRTATVFVLPLGGLNTEEVIELLNKNRREIRHIVTKSIHLKYSPQLKFVADDVYDRMDATRSLLNSERVRRDLAGPDTEEEPLD